MIPLFKVFMSPDTGDAVTQVLNSGYITQGPKVEEFETQLESFLENKWVLTLNSATAGLTLALRLLMDTNWRSGDIVLTPALTCFATTAAILANKVKIRWLDIDLETCNICLEDLKNKLNKHTKVIYLVHWGGTPVDLDKLDQICCEHEKNYGFKPAVVEDCAHALGAQLLSGKKIGSNKNICVFSTQAIKHLTTGDGGIITLPTQELYDRCKLLRWYGIDRNKRSGKDFRLENDIVDWGYKFHMNDINATIGLCNLPHIPELLKKNRDNAAYFDTALHDVSGIKILGCGNQGSAYWLYSIRVLDDKKEEFMLKMKEAGITTSQVHNRNDINTCVSGWQESLPNLDILEKELVCLPVGWWLSLEEREYIINNILDYFNYTHE